ncbi:MAG TPA: ABC transporter permease [Acetobacteraceae bacterium]|nr:ABC transporter permease [Acetobacteraceae bacterium]
MLRVFAARIATAAPILFVVSLLLFIALRLLPVDPAAMSMPPNATIDEIAAMHTQMGLDRPIVVQYGIWLDSAVHGDFGRSIHLRRPVLPLIGETLPATLELAVCAMVIAGVLGVGGGLGLFALRERRAEAVAETGTTLLMSIPEFLWALLFIFLFGVALHALPFTGRLDPNMTKPDITGFLFIDALLIGRPDVFASAVLHLVLPAAALGIAFSPPIMRVLRSSLLDVYHDDYIRQARLRGLSEWRILWRHALKNAALPTLTLMGVQFGFLFGGSLLVEVIYSYPGLGNLMVDAVRNTDLPLIQAIGLTYCIVVLIINTAVDSLYVVLNPKLRVR